MWACKMVEVPKSRSNKQLNNLMLLHRLYQTYVPAVHTWICVKCPKLAWNAWPMIIRSYKLKSHVGMQVGQSGQNPRSNKQTMKQFYPKKLSEPIVPAAHTWKCVTCPKLAWNAWPINAVNVFFHVNYLLIIDCCFKNTGRNYLHIIMVFTTQ